MKYNKRQQIAEGIVGTANGMLEAENYYNISHEEVLDIMIEFGVECCSVCGWYIGQDEISESDDDIVCTECVE